MRHAAHGVLGQVLTGRMPGVHLSAAGHAQAVALAEALAGEPVVAVVASPLERAQETAAPIAARHGLPVQTDPGLNEIDFGAWTGQPFAALAGPAWDAWNQHRGIAPTPGGETMLEAQARAWAAVRRLAAAQPEGALVLVSHQDVLKAVLAQALGLSLDLLHRFDLAPASRSVLSVWSGGARVEGLNLV